MAQTTEVGEVKETSEYEKMAEEAMKLGRKASDGDSDAIAAAIVEKLKREMGWKVGDSEEGLFRQAREIYWNWKEQKRKEKTGGEEMEDCSPENIMD